MGPRVNIERIYECLETKTSENPEGWPSQGDVEMGKTESTKKKPRNAGWRVLGKNVQPADGECKGGRGRKDIKRGRSRESKTPGGGHRGEKENQKAGEKKVKGGGAATKRRLRHRKQRNIIHGGEEVKGKPSKPKNETSEKRAAKLHEKRNSNACDTNQ